LEGVILGDVSWEILLLFLEMVDAGRNARGRMIRGALQKRPRGGGEILLARRMNPRPRREAVMKTMGGHIKTGMKAEKESGRAETTEGIGPRTGLRIARRK
jgi:hypothetical protein